MRILFLTQILPYPPDAGPKVKTWHVLRYLAARGYQVTLASFVRDEEQAFISALEEVCDQVYALPIRRSRLADLGYWLRSQRTGRPFLIERDDLHQMRHLVEKLLATQEIHAVHADQLTMAQFAFPRRQPAPRPWRSPGPNGRHPDRSARPALVFDAHNAVWTIVERMRQNSPALLKLALALEARRVKRYEGRIVQYFDHTLAVTEIDRQALLQAVHAAAHGLPVLEPEITVIPIAVDTDQLQPTRRRSESTNILTLGTLHYPPNADGIRWFAQEVFPLIHQRLPQATLTIVGKNPPPDLRQLAERQAPAIQVTGYVPNLEPYFEEAALAAIPVRAGGGMRVRILEAFARGVPVVTTTIGLEGIDAEPDRDVLVADSASEFAARTVAALTDPALQSSLAANGRRLVEERYDWKVVLKTLDRLYDSIEKTITPEGPHLV